MLDSPYLTLIGRVLLGLMFLVSGIHKIADPHGTQQYMIMWKWRAPCPCCLDTVHERSAGCCFCS
jgi:uncharacterized membrane protein YphA (DoxX/SURF4 family)